MVLEMREGIPGSGLKRRQRGAWTIEHLSATRARPRRERYRIEDLRRFSGRFVRPRILPGSSRHGSVYCVAAWTAGASSRGHGSWRLRGCADASALFTPETLRAFLGRASRRYSARISRGISRGREDQSVITWRPSNSSSSSSS